MLVSIPFAFENAPFSVRIFSLKAKHRIAGIEQYFNNLKRRLWQKTHAVNDALLNAEGIFTPNEVIVHIASIYLASSTLME